MIHEWRQAVVTKLADAFDGCDVRAGERDGVWRGPDDRDLIVVFWPGWEEITRDVSLAQPTLTVRLFPHRSKQPAEDTPADPSPLEQAADQLLAFFDRASQAPGFFVEGLSCRVTSIAPDYRPEMWRVEAKLQAYTLGAAA